MLGILVPHVGGFPIHAAIWASPSHWEEFGHRGSPFAQLYILCAWARFFASIIGPLIQAASISLLILGIRGRSPVHDRRWRRVAFVLASVVIALFVYRLLDGFPQRSGIPILTAYQNLIPLAAFIVLHALQAFGAFVVIRAMYARWREALRRPEFLAFTSFMTLLIATIALSFVAFLELHPWASPAQHWTSFASWALVRFSEDEIVLRTRAGLECLAVVGLFCVIRKTRANATLEAR